MNTIPKRRGGNPEREKRTQSPPPYLCTPSPLPTGEKHPAPAGFLIHQDARGGLRRGHKWTNTDTQSPRLASRAWRRGGCSKSTTAHTHQPAVTRFSSVARGGRGSRFLGTPRRSGQGISVQEGGEEVPERASAQTFSVLSSGGEMDAASPSQ